MGRARRTSREAEAPTEEQAGEEQPAETTGEQAAESPRGGVRRGRGRKRPAVAAGARGPRQRREPQRRGRRRRSRSASKAKARAAKPSGERKPIVRTPKPEHQRGRQKERRGIVVSSAMDKTIVVRVDTARPHRTYKKVVRRSKKFHAHDEQNEANVGDVVRIVETRPLSKTKSWRLAEILEAAK